MGFLRGLIAALLLIALGLGLLGVWGVSAYTNVAHAIQISGSTRESWAFGLTSLVADIFKVASVIGLAAALAARPRYWGRGILCGAIWCVTVGWSINANLGYQLTTIMEAREVGKATRQTDASIKKSIEDELDRIVKQQALLSQQTTTRATGADKHERSDVRDLQRDQMEELRRLERRGSELRNDLRAMASVSIAPQLSGDAFGRFFMERTGVSQASFDLMRVIFWLAVVELPATFGVFAFGHLYAFMFAPATSREMVGNLHHSPPAPEITPLATIRKSEVVAQPARIESALARVQAARDRIQPTSKRAQAETFLADLKVVYGTGAVLDGDDVRGMFPDWARREGIDTPITPWQLGQQLIACGVTKEARGAYRLP